MADRVSVEARNAALAAKFVTMFGAAGTVEAWNGAMPASLGAPAGTKLATLNMGNPAGTVANGVWTAAAYTQNNANHVNGTPTFLRCKKTDGTVFADLEIGAGKVTFNGTIANGQNITGAWTITEGNAA